MRPIVPSGWRWPSVSKLLILLLASLGLVGCNSESEPNYRAEFFTLGTQVEVQIRARTGDEAERQQAQQAFSVLGPQLQRMHRDWHPWEAGELSDLNAGLAQGNWTATSPELIDLIEISQTLETSADGLFNPAIGHVISRWGFHTSDFPITEAPPSRLEIDALLASRPSTLQIEIDDRNVRTHNPAIRLDFSGIGKGLAVHMVCEQLKQLGFQDALVNAGGDVMVCGETDQPWRVAIRDPAGGVLQTLAIDQPLAVFTSGNYYRYGEWNGERYAHILDPRNGQPVNQVMQATVIHADPLLADAAATALIVAGSEHWLQTADQMGIQR
ncbi:MAG: FAD:protein FMN transferase, partial [Pseudomonadota bacterium]